MVLKVGDITPLGAKKYSRGKKMEKAISHFQKVKIIEKLVLFVYLLVVIKLHNYLCKGYK